jgi:hypothetical protein
VTALAPRYRGRPQAADLDENIETIVADLGELPSNSN